MGYKIIATILTGMNTAKDALDAAIKLAEDTDAHLDIHVITINQSSLAYDLSGMSTPVVAAQTRDAIEEREQLEDWVQTRMQGEVVRWSMQAAMVQSLVLGNYLAEKLRFSDLVVLGRPYQDDLELAGLVENCMFIAGCPVLMIPKGAGAPAMGGNVVLGWNDGTEALSATRAALPFLRRAAETDICIIDPPTQGHDQSDPGSGMAQFLTRHGATPVIKLIAKTEGNVADTLLRCARDSGAALIVSGAYGHSRLREAVFGGTTRSLLENAEVPILMAR
ncbi:universal stress protein [Yoonia sp.]|uniref:universal stress protein n=1 Tax=Yoonia sp. TaxID=2212373 RepID=UPI0019F4B45B|nr:universal stress protein [Yoonia sp.]MBE0413470.1 universal stress protein [Yoonia sp.]